MLAIQTLSIFLQKRNLCTSNMKPVRGNAISCLTIWFHGHQKASSSIVSHSNLHHHSTDIHSFHIDRHLPAECPAKPLSFFFSDTLFSSSEEMDVLDVATWTLSTLLGLCCYNPEFVNTKWTDSDVFHIASFHYNPDFRTRVFDCSSVGTEAMRDSLDMWCWQNTTSLVITQTNTNSIKRAMRATRGNHCRHRRQMSSAACFKVLVSSLKPITEHSAHDL